MTAFQQLFWGFLFMFDFRLNGFDILPDIIGYWLFFVGLQKIMGESKHFEQAKVYVLPLMLVSVFDIYQFQGSSGFEPVSLLGMVIGLIILVLDLLVVYHLCRGIIQKAISVGDGNLENNAEKRWKYYMVLKVSFLVMFPLMLLLKQLSMIFFVPYFIFWIVVIILMMKLMKQADESLREEQPY